MFSPCGSVMLGECCFTLGFGWDRQGAGTSSVTPSSAPPPRELRRAEGESSMACPLVTGCHGPGVPERTVDRRLWGHQGAHVSVQLPGQSDLQGGPGVCGAAWCSMHALPSLHRGVVSSLITADPVMAQGRALTLIRRKVVALIDLYFSTSKQMS